MLPRTAWINITDKCNNKCQWCYGKNAFSGIETMSYQRVTQILDWLYSNQCKKCILIGGEPTLHPQIVEIMTHGSNLGLNMAIVSNGRRFASKDFCDKMLAAGLKPGRVTLSMSACSEESAIKHTRSKISFSQFEKGFDNLVQTGLSPGINIVISKPLFDYLETMLYWASEHNATHVTFNQSAPAFSPSSVDTSFCLPPDVLAKKTVGLYKLGNTLRIKVSFLFNVPFCLLSRDDVDMLLNANAIMSGCSVRSGSAILFNVNGDLITCNHLPFYGVHNFQTMESVYSENRFQEFWKSDLTIEAIRQAACVYRSHHCKKCDYWDMCAGGCPLFWASYDPQNYIGGWDIIESK